MSKSYNIGLPAQSCFVLAMSECVCGGETLVALANRMVQARSVEGNAYNEQHSEHSFCRSDGRDVAFG